MASILIIEDEDQVRVLAVGILKDAGHNVLSAGGREAAKAILESDQPVDILITDLNVGGDPEGGLAIAKFATEERPGIKVIYTTGQGVTDGMISLFVPASEFLPKPYTPDHLLFLVGRVFPN